MRIELHQVTTADKPALARLLELYCHDLSAFRPYELSPDGTFGYRFLDVYFEGDPDHDAMFVFVDGELAGFAMTLDQGDGVRTIAEFFVVRRWRRHGVGRAVALQLFARHPGGWIVAFDDANEAGRNFWPDVCKAAAADGNVTAQRKPEGSVYPGVELTFRAASGSTPTPNQPPRTAR